METNMFAFIGGFFGFVVGFFAVYVYIGERQAARRVRRATALAHVRHLRERINPEDAFAKAELDRLKRLLMEWE